MQNYTNHLSLTLLVLNKIAVVNMDLRHKFIGFHSSGGQISAAFITI